MTALTQYQRLESPGVWHQSPESQRRDVIVSLGDATLILKDRSDMALTHWSLAAIVRIAPGDDPAIFAPGPEDDERLELTEPDMIAALDTIRRAVHRRKPRRGRLRLWGFGALAAAVLALGLFWLPEALISHTARAMPEATRQEIGRRLVIALEPQMGRPCRNIEGRRALDQLQRRLFAEAPWQLRVLASGPAPVLLPGGLILLSGEGLAQAESPDRVAGALLAASVQAAETDPMLWVLHEVGPWETFGLLTTGRLSDRALAAAARGLAQEPVTLPAAGAPLLARFAAAEISSAAYGAAVGWAAGVAGDPYPQGSPRPSLSDAAWLRLQSICE